MAAITGSTKPVFSYVGDEQTLSSWGFTHKLVFNYTDMNTVAATSGTYSYPAAFGANDLFSDFYYIVNTKFVGASITALNFIAGFNYTTATDVTNAFVTTASDLATASYNSTLTRGAGTGNVGAAAIDAGVLDFTFTATGANLSALTAGQLTVYWRHLPWAAEGALI